MPAYDYRCIACGHRFEVQQRITEPAGAPCPACSDASCERLITGGTFHLKGSGWYASDYTSKPANCEEKAEAPKAGGCGLSQCGTGACAAAAAADA